MVCRVCAQWLSRPLAIEVSMSKAKTTLSVFIVAILAKQNLDDCDNGPCHVDLFRDSVDDIDL
jgi:hypothetical protein